MARVQCAAGAWQFEATSVGNQANGQFSYVSYAHQGPRWGGEKRETKLNVILMMYEIKFCFFNIVHYRHRQHFEQHPTLCDCKGRPRIVLFWPRLVYQPL